MEQIFPFNFFQRTHLFPDYSFLGADMHSHLLPGIDDGAQNMTESIELVNGLRALGFEALYTTPHVMSDRYPNTPDTIARASEQLLAGLVAANHSTIRLQAAAEYLLDDAFGTLIEKGDLLTLPGKRVLVEESFVAPSPRMEEHIFTLCVNGYIPVMAHPERYHFWQKSLAHYKKLLEMGCDLQVNLLSLTGYGGKEVERSAYKLVESGMVSFLATDLHNGEQLKILQKALSNRKMARLFSRHQFQNINLV
jgi:tyrosine-protein phosphatase YwqE